MDHKAEEQLAAHALGALDSEERQWVEVHLDGCTRCQAALASYESVADGLLHAPDRMPVPGAVRSRLSKQIGRPADLPRWRSAVKAVPAAGLAMAVGLILLLAVNLGFLVQTQRLLDQGQGALAQQQAGLTAAAIASYPSSQVAVIEEDGVRGTLVYDPSLPVGVMYVWGLQPPSDDQTYQTWLVDAEGQRTSAGLLTFSADPGFGWLMIEAPTPMGEFKSLGVTLEPAGGSEAPTGPRILGTDL
ncbi:MAG: anti-sigma factor [Anaerolineae bacterium]|nr:MAG: anti-sigma factor [Anaerolineae bacterium]